MILDVLPQEVRGGEASLAFADQPVPSNLQSLNLKILLKGEPSRCGLDLLAAESVVLHRVRAAQGFGERRLPARAFRGSRADVIGNSLNNSETRRSSD